MPIKVTMRYHSIPTTMSEIQDSENSCPWSGCGAIGTLTNCWWEYNMEQPLWKKVWQFLTKLNIVLPYDPAIAFLSFPKEIKKTYVSLNPAHICISFLSFFYFKFFFFYCCSITVVSIFPSPLSPTPLTTTSHPQSYPPLALLMGTLYTFLDDPSLTSFISNCKNLKAMKMFFSR